MVTSYVAPLPAASPLTSSTLLMPLSHSGYRRMSAMYANASDGVLEELTVTV